MSLESSQTEQTWKAQDLIYAFLETEWRNGESERVSEEQKDEDATTEVTVLCLVWNLWGWFMKHVSSSWFLRLVKTRAMTQPHFLNTKSSRIEQLHEETFQWHQMVSFPSSSSSLSSMRAPVSSHLPLFLQHQAQDMCLRNVWLEESLCNEHGHGQAAVFECQYLFFAEVLYRKVSLDIESGKNHTISTHFQNECSFLFEWWQMHMIQNWFLVSVLRHHRLVSCLFSKD